MRAIRSARQTEPEISSWEALAACSDRQVGLLNIVIRWLTNSARPQLQYIVRHPMSHRDTALDAVRVTPANQLCNITAILSRLHDGTAGAIQSTSHAARNERNAPKKAHQEHRKNGLHYQVDREDSREPQGPDHD